MSLRAITDYSESRRTDLVLFAISGLLLLSLIVARIITSNQWTLYESERHEVQLEYPPGWQLRESGTYIEVASPPNQGGISERRLAVFLGEAVPYARTSRPDYVLRDIADELVATTGNVLDRDAPYEITVGDYTGTIQHLWVSYDTTLPEELGAFSEHVTRPWATITMILITDSERHALIQVIDDYGRFDDYGLGSDLQRMVNSFRFSDASLATVEFAES